jgi:ABC-type transporter Mla subunit MlaD
MTIAETWRKIRENDKAEPAQPLPLNPLDDPPAPVEKTFEQTLHSVEADAERLRIFIERLHQALRDGDANAEAIRAIVPDCLKLASSVSAAMERLEKTVQAMLDSAELLGRIESAPKN